VSNLAVKIYTAVFVCSSITGISQATDGNALSPVDGIVNAVEAILHRYGVDCGFPRMPRSCLNCDTTPTYFSDT
jgi:hypothetical protein